MESVRPESPDLLLLSGGIESSALLAQCHAAGKVLRAVWVDYGQRNAAREWAAVEHLAGVYGATPVALDLQSLRAAFTRRNDWVGHVPLPQRNLLVLALAVNLAEHHGAGRILLALNREDQGHGPGSQPGFVEQVSALAGTLIPRLQVEAPLIEQSKAEIIATTDPLGIDWRRTWSCLLAQSRHCGRCPQCQARRAAFAAAGIPDPTDYREAPR
ncbi:MULTISPECIES: 7-cyano-7-deazaguanine synthase [unclassified Thioalkalivibrio]|uniref:7-cyano-7-deazaguanine synthase n=1 Tax=unclassified Thioalkalivibrio TaxID=2621013 RepID=UPI000382F2B0|nr:MULTISPECIES: 7-cyano-7-deazaguanine synthase [unclassified Thioalkalivibrio]